MYKSLYEEYIEDCQEIGFEGSQRDYEDRLRKRNIIDFKTTIDNEVNNAFGDISTKEDKEE